MKTAKVAVEIMIMLVVVVITSAVLLFLIRSDAIEVKPAAQENILNTDFIPLAREGFLDVKEFQFCDDVDNNFNCLGEQDMFTIGSEVHFRFVVESTVYNGEVYLVENYRVTGPEGILLEVDESDNFYFRATSDQAVEPISFRDYFTLGFDVPAGEYTMELLIENPLLNKNSRVVRKFEVLPGAEENILAQ